MSTLSESAEIALAVAHRFGVACERPVVLAEGMSTVVHLRPSSIVARVTRVAHLVRPVEEVNATVALARALHGFVVPPTPGLAAKALYLKRASTKYTARGGVS